MELSLAEYCSLYRRLLVQLRVGNFRQKKCSAEDGIDVTIDLFSGTENSQNSIPNLSAEEKNARNFVPWNKNRSKLSEFLSEAFRRTENSWNSVPNRSAGEKNARNFVPWKKIDQSLGIWSRIFCKTNFFHAIFFLSEPRN